MIWRVEILPIPARWEDDGCADATGAILVGQLGSILRIAGGKALAVAKTAMADGRAISFLRHWIASYHAEARFEGCHFVVLCRVWHVIHCHATILLESNVGELRNALKYAILG
jgi:hypothetical protein